MPAGGADHAGLGARLERRLLGPALPSPIRDDAATQLELRVDSVGVWSAERRSRTLILRRGESIQPALVLRATADALDQLLAASTPADGLRVAGDLFCAGRLELDGDLLEGLWLLERIVQGDP